MIDPLDTTPSRPKRKNSAKSAHKPAALEAQPMKVGASFIDGFDGGPKAQFAKLRPAFNPLNPMSFVVGSTPNRDASLAASIATEQSLSNPTMAAIIDTLQVYCVGTGLTLSYKPDGAALGIEGDELAELSHTIETAFGLYANNALHCDWSARFNLHEMADIQYRVFLLTGEEVANFGWKRHPGSEWASKVNMLNPGQLASDVTRLEDGRHVMQGVAFDDAGVLVGYYIRPAALGSINVLATPKFYPARMRFGRHVILHKFEARDARQLRGISPIIAGLSPAEARAFLGENVLASAALQAGLAVTIESDSRPQDLADSLHTNDDMSGMAEWARDRHDWYDKAKVDFAPGKVNFLARGDKLHMNSPASPNQTFHEYDKSFVRQAARAAGSTYEDASGDYSETNFAASRMANFIPSLMNKKRRNKVVVPFYQSTFENWLEEALARGVVKMPKNAPPFWAARDAWCRAKWLGVPAPEPDRGKAANAIEKELSTGANTLTDVLAERGIDFDDHIAALSAEAKALEEIGMVHPMKLAALKAENASKGK